MVSETGEMSNCNKNPITIFPCEIEKYGVVEAIIIQQIRNWTMYNEKSQSQQHYQNEHWWCYGSMTKWEELTGISKNTLKKKFKSLEDDGIIISDNFNKLPFDRTKWYRLNPSVHMEKSIVSNRPNGEYPTDQISLDTGDQISFGLTEPTIPMNMNEMNMNFIPFNSLLEKFNYPKDRSNRIIKQIWEDYTENERKEIMTKVDDFISYAKGRGYNPNLKQFLTDGWTWDLTIQSKTNKINKTKEILL